MRFKIVRYERIESGKPRGHQAGAGDLVARIAKPIARTIDRIAGTRLQDCGGCERRQARLNEMFPFD
jgi:hypothetical protein